MSAELFQWLQVVLGIGLVIFVHEAGHFLAARWCGVRVEVFSLGFGPRLFGWRRGATLYQIAAVPVGGYVRMAGELPNGRGRPQRPDDLVSKSVGQRFFIYSGGVLMNVVFALVVFPIVLASGVPTNEPLVVPDKGSPAWKAGLERGTRVLAVDGEEVWDFFHIPNEVALADRGPVDFVLLPPGATEPVRLPIEPVYSDNGGFRQIGVRPAADPGRRLLVDESGPAARAGLRGDDRLLGVEGQPAVLEPLVQLDRSLEGGGPVRLRVEREGVEHAIEVAPEPGPESKRRYLGIEPLWNVVADWRPGNPWLERLGLVRGERLTAVDGLAVTRSADLLGALLAPASGAEGIAFTFEDADGAPRVVRLPERPTAAEAVGLDADLFLDRDEDSTLLRVQPDRPAALAGLATGDRLLSVATTRVETWGAVLEATRPAAERGEPVVVVFERRDPATADGGPGAWTPHTVVVRPETHQQIYYGFGLRPARGVYRTTSLGESISAGMTASWRFLTDAWLTLRRMLTRQVSTENLGGIITIGTVSYSFAEEGWAKLFFFLCMLSINLAFINVLPIPVLDGGHLFFCVIEAIKGSPVSERTLGYSQIVGLVLIVTLMVYVTYQDVLRLLT